MAISLGVSSLEGDFATGDALNRLINFLSSVRSSSEPLRLHKARSHVVLISYELMS